MNIDEEWAPIARSSREALALLGYNIGPKCLPGEPEFCGGSWAQHTMAQMGAIKAVADHHLSHLGALSELHGKIYWRIRDELAEIDREMQADST